MQHFPRSTSEAALRTHTVASSRDRYSAPFSGEHCPLHNHRLHTHKRNTIKNIRDSTIILHPSPQTRVQTPSYLPRSKALFSQLTSPPHSKGGFSFLGSMLFILKSNIASTRREVCLVSLFSNRLCVLSTFPSQPRFAFWGGGRGGELQGLFTKDIARPWARWWEWSGVGGLDCCFGGGEVCLLRRWWRGCYQPNIEASAMKACCSSCHVRA